MVVGDIARQNPLEMPLVQNEQDKENPEGCCWKCEEIQRNGVFGMICQKRPPCLGRRPTSLDHVLGDRGFGDIDAELE